MDNRYYDGVIREMQPFFDENGFALNGDGSFSNDKKRVKVSYDEPKQMYVLSAADVTDGTAGDYADISTWLFDDSQLERDAAAVGIDFTDTLRSSMGIKIKRAVNAEIDLPNSTKDGSMTVSGFTKKVLDVFPAFKEQYKAHIAKYGNFLYLSFFGETLVPQVKTMLTENNKKQNKKLYDLFEDAYVHGDRDTVNTVVAVIAAAVYKNDELKQNAVGMLSEDKHFINALEAFIPVLARNKKLLAFLDK